MGFSAPFLWAVRVGQQSGAVFGEVAFEDEDGGHLVDEVLAFNAGGMASGAGEVSGLIEKEVGLAGGETFVDEVVLQRGVRLAECDRKCVCLG